MKSDSENEDHYDSVLQDELSDVYDIAGTEDKVVSGNDDAKTGPKQKEKEKEKKRKEIISYKYTNRGKDSLHEAILLAGKPVFIKYDDNSGQIRVVENIQEANRIIKPPYPEECPYESYEFANIEEIQSFVQQAKSTTIDSLYLKAKVFVQEYNDQDNTKLVLIASDIIFSYFQDKFATTHYDSIVGDNDSGKSSLGITFEALGYRPVYMTDPSAANIFRCLGSTEPGQCTIILDEADKIDKSPEMMAILKTGYQLNGKVPKINTNTLRQEFFLTYGLKIIISERSMSLTEAKGVHDRTFSFTVYPGDSKFDIKETLNPQGNIECQSRLDEILDFKKLMLIYRLIHFKKFVPDIDTGLKRRNRELCKPVLQLFHGSELGVQNEITSMLEHFLAVKKHKKESTIEVGLHPIISNLVSGYGTKVPASYIWGTMITGNVIEGYYDERKPNEYQTADYGTIYRNSITNIICDKFGAQRRHKEKGNVLIFDVDKLVRIGKSYDLGTKIQLKLLTEKEKAEGSEGYEGFRQATSTFREHDNIQNGEIETLNDDILRVSSNNPAKYISQKTDLQDTDPVKPSGSSEPSAIIEESNLKQETSKEEEMKAILIPISKPIPNTIYKLGRTDIYGCRNCCIKGDRWDMVEHPKRCQGSKTCKSSKKNRNKVTTPTNR